MYNIQSGNERRMSKSSEFACEQCEFKSPSNTLLKRHTESAHKCSCEQCDYKSPSRTTLRMHVGVLTILHVRNVTTNQQQKHFSKDMQRVPTNLHVDNATINQHKKQLSWHM